MAVINVLNITSEELSPTSSMVECTDSNRPTTLDTAQTLLALGMSVFPLPYGRKKPAVERLNKEGNIQYFPDGKPITNKLPWKCLGFTRNRLREDTVQFVFAGQCNIAVVVGRVSDNLVVLDCETGESFESIKSLFRQQNIPIFAVRTGGGGGHIYLRSIDGEMENVSLNSGVFNQMEIRGNSAYVVATSSLHPETGAFYDWDVRESSEPPQLTLVQIQVLLEPIFLKPFQLKLTRSNSRHPSQNNTDSRYNLLAYKTRRFLESGASEGSRNQSFFNAACDMYGCGYDQSEVQQMAGSQAENCGLSPQEVISTIKSAFSTPRTPARGYHNGVQPQDWHSHSKRAHAKAQALTFACNHDWGKGKTASTDHKVFEAFIVRLENGGYPDKNSGQITFRASVAEIGEIAHISNPNTIVNAIRRLESAGLIKQKGADQESAARLWQLSERIGSPRKRSTTSFQVGGIPSATLSQSPAAECELEYGELGYNGKLVYNALVKSSTPQTAKAIAKATGLCLSKVQYVLRTDTWLRRKGVVSRIGKCYQAHPLSKEEMAELVSERSQQGPEKRQKQNQQRREIRMEQKVIRWRKAYDVGHPDNPHYGRTPISNKPITEEASSLTANERLIPTNPVETETVLSKQVNNQEGDSLQPNSYPKAQLQHNRETMAVERQPPDLVDEVMTESWETIDFLSSSALPTETSAESVVELNVPSPKHKELWKKDGKGASKYNPFSVARL